MPCARALFFRPGGACGCNACQLLAATGITTASGGSFLPHTRSSTIAHVLFVMFFRIDLCLFIFCIFLYQDACC